MQQYPTSDEVRAKLYATSNKTDTVSTASMANFNEPTLLHEINSKTKTAKSKTHAQAQKNIDKKNDKKLILESAFKQANQNTQKPQQAPNRVDEAEKCELLFTPHERAITKAGWARAIGIYFFITLLCCVYIFVRELIYISSKEYAELEGKKEVLIEENKELERKIEALQFKNKITNYFEVKYE